ncbi:MAG: type IV pili methyl-accepting chemotaxis transducer N-terminal domain-containing protein [Pseudomonadota bacterium]
MKQTKWAGVLFAVLFSSLATAAWQGRMTENDAIDKAGMQRMLSQRILKSYCELGLGEDTGTSHEQLQQAVNLFEANLLQLETLPVGEAVKAGLARVRTAWAPYRELALTAPSKDNAQKMLAIAHQLLPLTHEVVVQMEQDASSATGRLVNVAGRQRMLSQRMAMFYLLRLWGVGGPDEEAMADTAAKEYAAGLKELRAFGGNNKEMVALLNNLDRAYQLLLKARSDKAGNLSFLISTTSERMLDDADQLTALYGALDKK